MSAFDEKLSELGITVTHHFSEEQYTKETFIPAGVTLVQHKHKFDHYSWLHSGTAIVSVDGDDMEFTGPRLILIEAGKHHGVKAVTDVLWFCVNETDCDDPDEIDAELIEDGDPQEMMAIAARLSQ